MTEMETLGVLAILRECYPREPMSSLREDMYVRLLLDLELQDATEAVTRVLARSPFMPTIAEIRHEVALAKVDAEPAELAWAEVRRALASHGSGSAPTFVNRFTQEVVKSIGWMEICRSGRPGADRAHFLRMYEAAVQREIDDVQLPRQLHYPAQRRRLGHDERAEVVQVPLVERVERAGLDEGGG